MPCGGSSRPAGGAATSQPSTVHHRPRGSWRGLVAQRVAYGSSAAALARKHPGALAPLRVSGWSAGVWALLGTGHPALAAGVVAGTAAALVRKLPGVPAAESVRLTVTGHLFAGRLVADAARRAWWPLLAAGSLVSRRARRITVLAALPALASGGLPKLVDDIAYGFGVWKGVLTRAGAGAAASPLPVVAGRRRDAAEQRLTTATVGCRDVAADGRPRHMA